MPPGSAFEAEQIGGPLHRHWSLDTHLVASVLEVLMAANWQRSGGKGKKPKPLKRPKSKQSRQGGVKLASLAPRRPKP